MVSACFWRFLIEGLRCALFNLLAVRVLAKLMDLFFADASVDPLSVDLCLVFASSLDRRCFISLMNERMVCAEIATKCLLFQIFILSLELGYCL